MPNQNILENIKKLRELTGVGFKDCKIALDETNGDLEKSIEFLRKKGIAKASKKMSRTASEGLVIAKEEKGNVSIIEVNIETDFVAKNKDFIDFCKELSEINFSSHGDVNKINNSKMSNNSTVEQNLVNLISKIGEKITFRRAKYFDNKKGTNFFYVHSAFEKNIGKIVAVVKIENINNNQYDNLGNKIAMHIAALNPLAINSKEIDKKIVDKELEIIKEEIKNSGKPPEMVEKISKGKITKFLNDNSLLGQIWIMDPKKKVSDILKENSEKDEIKILDFVRFKVGEGV